MPRSGDDITHAANVAPAPVSDGNGVPAVRRASAILWLLAEHPTPLTLSQVAKGASILPSTALQILRELAAARLIAIDVERKVYKLGQGLIDLAKHAVDPDTFTTLSQPHLQDIASRFDVTATATEAIDDRHCACVVSITPPESLSLNVTLGGRVPILSGAAGRCIAAFSKHSPAQLRQSFDGIRWHLPLEFEEWMAQVKNVPSQGYAEDEGLFAAGVTTLAAPIFAPDGTVTRAIGVATITAALAASRKKEIVAALVAASRQITDALRR